MHYAGARYYMSALGRWNGPDPLSHLYPKETPYSFVLGNPVSLADPTGMCPEGVNSGEAYINKDGEKTLCYSADGVTVTAEDVSSDYRIERRGWWGRIWGQQRYITVEWYYVNNDWYFARRHDAQQIRVATDAGNPLHPLAAPLGAACSAQAARLSSLSTSTRRALSLVSRNSNDVNHIMSPHHLRGKIMANPPWSKVKAVIGEVLEKGVPQSYKSVNSKVLSYRGGKVQVVYVKLPNGQTRISNAWVQNSSQNPIK